MAQVSVNSVGDVNFHRNAVIDGTLYMVGGTTFNSAVTFSNTATINGLFTAAGLSTFTGNATFANSVTVNGQSSINGLLNANNHSLLEKLVFIGKSSITEYNKQLNVECSNTSGCTGSTRYGTYSLVKDASTGYGIYGKSDGNYGSTGVYGYATAGYSNTGVYGRSVNGAYSTGIYGYASGGGYSNYGIRGYASGTNSYGGYFTGGVYISGGLTQASDERLKKNKRSLENKDVAERVLQITPLSYEFLDSSELQQNRLPKSHIQKGRHFGVSAQELETLFPDLVTDVLHVLDDGIELQNGVEPETIVLKAVNYQELTVLLLATLQEQNERIEALEKALKSRK